MKVTQAYGVNEFSNYDVIDREGNLLAGDVRNGKVEESLERLLPEPALSDASATSN